MQPAIARRIVEAAEVEAGDRVIEIGPGLGVLSERIATYPVAKFAMVELDARLATRLADRFSEDRRVKILVSDFLKLDLRPLLGEGGVKVIGNLPFNAAAAILRRLCDHYRSIIRMVLMFQREVAERIRARPGESDYGALSVFTALYFDIESYFRVGAGNFHPRPKVDAEVLVIRPRRAAPFAEGEEPRVLRTVRAAFSAPRKTLRNALSRSLGRPLEQIDLALASAAVDPRARAATLAVDDLVRLARVLQPDADAETR